MYMEECPQKRKRDDKYQEALEKARTKPDEWRNAQIWTLGHYLGERALKMPNKTVFDKEFEELKDRSLNLESLIALGNKYNMLADYDLEAESLKVFCKWNHVELL